MIGKEGSVLDFNAMVNLRDSGGIPNQLYNRSARNGSGSEKTWYEDVEACIDCDPDPCCPQVAKFLKRAIFSLGIQEGLSKKEIEELYNSYIKDDTIQ